MNIAFTPGQTIKTYSVSTNFRLEQSARDVEGQDFLSSELFRVLLGLNHVLLSFQSLAPPPLLSRPESEKYINTFRAPSENQWRLEHLKIKNEGTFFTIKHSYIPKVTNPFNIYNKRQRVIFIFFSEEERKIIPSRLPFC